MDYVNMQVAIGGDTGNTVPKFYVPVSEIPVLLAIHGPDSLFDFEPVEPHDGIETLNNAEELERLNSIYGHVQDNNGDNVLRQVYPGAGARVITKLDAIDIPDGAFKVLSRVTAKDKADSKPLARAAAKPKAETDDKAQADKSVLE